jgi:hypothetical protein
VNRIIDIKAAETLVLLLAFIIFAPPLHGQEMDAPVDVQLQLFIKILTFDRNLNVQPGDKIEFVVIYQDKYKLSKSTANSIRKEVKDANIDNVDGVPIEWIFTDINSPKDFANEIAKYKIAVAYFTPLRAIDIKKLVSICRQYKVNTLSGVVDYLNEGIAVAVGIKADKPQIIVNLDAAKAEKSDYSSQLLKLCKILESTEVK